jgi:hypothetical protein
LAIRKITDRRSVFIEEILCGFAKTAFRQHARISPQFQSPTLHGSPQGWCLLPTESFALGLAQVGGFILDQVKLPDLGNEPEGLRTGLLGGFIPFASNVSQAAQPFQSTWPLLSQRIVNAVSVGLDRAFKAR